jgi:hypothetical protein
LYLIISVSLVENILFIVLASIISKYSFAVEPESHGTPQKNNDLMFFRTGHFTKPL